MHGLKKHIFFDLCKKNLKNNSSTHFNLPILFNKPYFYQKNHIAHYIEIASYELSEYIFSIGYCNVALYILFLFHGLKKDIFFDLCELTRKSYHVFRNQRNKYIG